LKEIEDIFKQKLGTRVYTKNTDNGIRLVNLTPCKNFSTTQCSYIVNNFTGQSP